MSVFISSYNSTSSPSNDQDLDEQQRRKERELRLRKRADRQTMEGYLETRQQEVAAQLHEGAEKSSQGLLHALLHDEFSRARERAAEETSEQAAEAASVSQRGPRDKPVASPGTLVSRPSSQTARDRSAEPAGRVAVPGAGLDRRSAGTSIGGSTHGSAAVEDLSVSKGRNDEAVRDGSARIAGLADQLDRTLSDLQACAAEGEASVEKLFVMLEAVRRSATGLKRSELDAAAITRIDGACHFLSAYIDSMDCTRSERASLIRKLEESRSLIREPQQSPSLQDPAFDSHAQMEPEAQANRDRQTLYAYLDLLKSLAKPPRDAAEARQLAARLAEMQLANPSAALKRLAESGDQSASLYIGEISRRLQKVDARERNSRASGLRGSLGDWLENERANMRSAIRHAEEVGAYACLKRSRDEARELELRAETMPLVVLQKA